MWWKEYRDYPHDRPLKKMKIESGKGIIGCEMHEIHGYGESFHNTRVHKREGLLHSLKKVFSRLRQLFY